MNILVDIALLSWPLLCVAFFLNTTPTRAMLYSILGSMLLLPMRAGYDFPGLPYVGKEELATIGVLIGLIITAPQLLNSARPLSRKDCILWILLLGGFTTALSNGDPLTWGVREGNKLTAYDGLSYAVGDLLRFGLPFFIGRALFQTRRDMRELLVFIGVAGLFASLIAIVEMRLSPQFHDWVYGYHQIEFRRTFRLGGYRPKGFMWNGLAFSLFILVSAIALATLQKAKISLPSNKLISQHAAKYQVVIMVLCRSLGTIGYSFMTLPFVWWGNSRTIMRVASAIAVLVIAYPFMRMTDTFPTDFLVDQATNIDADRSQSLAFRFKNEDLLIAKALERPLFGWGGSGRARIYDEEDGEDISTTDGTWIIRFGMRGIVGWGATFALLLLPVWRARKSLPYLQDERDRVQVAGLALILSVYAMDLLPNALFANFPIFLGGALFGITGNISRNPAARSRQRGNRPPPLRNKRQRPEGDLAPPAVEAPQTNLHSTDELYTRDGAGNPFSGKR